MVCTVDKISRAIGSLKNCYLIQSSEVMDHLSLIRLAADFEFLPEKYRSLADRMFIEVQSSHVQLSAGKPIEPGRGLFVLRLRAGVHPGAST